MLGIQFISFLFIITSSNINWKSRGKIVQIIIFGYKDDLYISQICISLPSHIGRLHFLAPFAITFNHMTGMWPMGCEKKVYIYMYTFSRSGYKIHCTLDGGLKAKTRPSLLVILPVVWIVNKSMPPPFPLFSFIWFRKLIALGAVLNSHSFLIFLMNSFQLIASSCFTSASLRWGKVFLFKIWNRTRLSFREEGLEVTILFVEVQASRRYGVEAHFRA